MKNDDFTEMLLRNNEEEEISYIITHGKKPNRINPIFMFDGIDKDELDEYKKSNGIS